MSRGGARAVPLAAGLVMGLGVMGLGVMGLGVMGLGVMACQPRIDGDCLERCARLDIGERECQTICAHDCEHLEQTYGISPQACRELHEGPPPRPEPPAGSAKSAGS